MTIRLEQPKDYREVENLTREAFWNVYRPGCTEHYVLWRGFALPCFTRAEIHWGLPVGDLCGSVCFKVFAFLGIGREDWGKFVVLWPL